MKLWKNWTYKQDTLLEFRLEHQLFPEIAVSFRQFDSRHKTMDLILTMLALVAFNSIPANAVECKFEIIILMSLFLRSCTVDHIL